MSLVGNFAFGNNDRSVDMTGVGSPGARRPSFFQDDEHQVPNPIEPTKTRPRSYSKPTGGEILLNASDASRTISDQETEKLREQTSSEEDLEQNQVRGLAREYTRQSLASNVDHDIFRAERDSALDPSSDNFRPRAWTKAMLRMRHEQGDSGFLERKAGVSFRNLSAHGEAGGADYQASVGNVWLQLAGSIKDMLSRKKRRIDILKGCDGLVKPGEMLVVLGPPGSGCSTFLKTIAGEVHGYELGKQTHINYTGVSFNEMHSSFRGETIYTAEQDVHFPQMTVGDTLYFAARARAPSRLPGNVSKEQYAEHLRDVIMATFGIRHTVNTRVGNEYVRGVSGGERKRVSIAEACLSGAPLQCWDNSTRGLDSANAIEFCKTIRTECEISSTTAMVAIYQAPQAAYDIFDKAIVLYEGRQIYFGDSKRAKRYFENLGFECPARQTDADFLTSMTSHVERHPKKGWENKIPRTPDEFEVAWQ